METEVKPRLRLGSYNVRAGLGTDMRRDAARAIRTIAGLGADILALQEADFRLGQRPAALPPARLTDETGLHIVPAGRHATSLGWHGIALLHRPSIEVSDIHRLDLPGLEPRGALITDFETELGPLRVVAVHLGLLRRSRKSQLAYIDSHLHDLAPRPTVMIGDFNEWSRKKGFDTLSDRFNVLRPGATFPSRRPVLGLDRVVHCEGLLANVQVARPEKGPHPSDHLPILAEIELGAAAP